MESHDLRIVTGLSDIQTKFCIFWPPFEVMHSRLGRPLSGSPDVETAVSAADTGSMGRAMQPLLLLFFPVLPLCDYLSASSPRHTAKMISLSY